MKKLLLSTSMAALICSSLSASSFDEKSISIVPGAINGYVKTGFLSPIPSEEIFPIIIEAEGSFISTNENVPISSCTLLAHSQTIEFSKKVDIRLDNIKCSIKNDDDHYLEAKVQGWVVGKDGSPGIEGKENKTESGKHFIEIESGKKIYIVLKDNEPFSIKNKTVSNKE